MHLDSKSGAITTPVCVLVAGVLLVAAGADAAAKKRVGVFPLIVARGGNARTAAAVQEALADGIDRAAGLEILWGKVLRNALQMKPRKAVSRCERRRRFAACFAELATKIGVDALLLARLAPSDQGSKLVVIAITPSRAVGARLSADIGNYEDVAFILTPEKVLEILGQPQAEFEPEPSVARGEQQRAPPSRGPRRPATDTEPTAARIASLPPESHRSPSGGTAADGMDATTAPDMDLSREADSGSAASPLLRYGGIVLTIAGAAAIGVGAYYGDLAAKQRKAVVRDGSINQQQALDDYNAANRSSKLANALFLGGGAAAVVGATMVTIDLAW